MSTADPSHKLAIAVLSLDRVGIVSNVTGTILRLGGNIDMMSQTVMSGCFTVLITAVFDAPPDAEMVRREIEEAGRDLNLEASVRPWQEPAAGDSDGAQTYFLTVSGSDRKGVVHEITNCLAGHGINILDLYCFIRPPDEFLLISEVAIPPDRDLQQVRIDLEETGDHGGLTVRIQHEDLFRATNNLYLKRHAAPQDQS